MLELEPMPELERQQELGPTLNKPLVLALLPVLPELELMRELELTLAL